jgi:O-antigen ligase
LLIENTSDSRLITFLDKGIIAVTFLFALGTLTSKAATSVGMGFAILFWLIRIIITKDYNFTSTKLDKVILFFLAGVLISSFDVGKMKFLDGSHKFILVILFYYALVNSIDDLTLVKRLSYTTLFSMLVAVGYGFYQRLYLGGQVNSFSFTLSFGCLLAMFLMFSLAYLFWGQVGNKTRFGLLLLSGSMLISLLWTEARGAWLGFIGASLSLAWLKDKRLIVGLLICLVLISFFLPNNYIAEFKSSFDIKENSSNLGRLALWKGSWEMFKDHFINGVGLGHFTDQYLAHYEQPNTTNAKHAHNNFLHLLATTGIIGFTAFCALLLMILKVLYMGYQRISDENWQLFILASLAAVIAFNIQGVTEYNFYDSETLRFFWFLLALDIVVINQLIFKKEEESELSKR